MQQGGGFGLKLGSLTLPFDIHGATDDKSGAAQGPRLVKFRFSHRGIPFLARYDRGAQPCLLDLSAELGPMPFSVESTQARTGLQTIMDAANADVGPVFRVVEGRIHLIAAVALETPVTAVGLITAVTTFLLPLRAYLETVEVFLVPPAELVKNGGSPVRSTWRRKPKMAG